MGEGSGKALSFSATTNGLSYKDTSLSLGNGSNYMNPWYNFEINLQSQFLKAGVVSESEWGGACRWGREQDAGYWIWTW